MIIQQEQTIEEQDALDLTIEDYRMMMSFSYDYLDDKFNAEMNNH
jgi:uncharacterized membrane protein YcgQ (UPF0703/DUF1980 family)